MTRNRFHIVKLTTFLRIIFSLCQGNHTGATHPLADNGTALRQSVGFGDSSGSRSSPGDYETMNSNNPHQFPPEYPPPYCQQVPVAPPRPSQTWNDQQVYLHSQQPYYCTNYEHAQQFTQWAGNVSSQYAPVVNVWQPGYPMNS